MRFLSRFTTTHFIFHLVTLASLLPNPSFSLYDDSDDVQTIKNKSEFNSKILKSDSVWMVQFYAPWCGHCKNISPKWKELSTILKGIVPVAVIDAATEGPQQRIAQQYNVTGFPTIKIFGSDKSKPVDYKGEREVQPMIQAAMNEIVKTVESRANVPPGGGKTGGGGGGGGGERMDVFRLTTSDFERVVLDSKDVWMIAFIAPWCGHCKALLPEWAAAMKKLKGSGAYLAVVDATVETELADQYDVKSYPTIKVFPGGEKTMIDARDYPGGRTEQQIIEYALEEVDRTGVPKEIAEMTGFEILKENCDMPNKICVLAALPHILDSKASGRNKYRDVLAAVAKRFRASPVDFMWFEGSSQPKFESAMELTFGFPAVVAISMGKNAYAVQRGSFSENNIGKFLSAIMSGRQVTTKLEEWPEVKTVEPWDGKDGVPFEDEPLDDIMGWDEEGEL